MAVNQKLVALLILFLPVQLGYHFWPDWSIILGRRVDYLSPTVYLTDLIVFLIIVLFIVNPPKKDVSIYRKSESRELKKVFLKNKHWLIAVLFVLANVWFSQNRPVAIYKWIKAVELVCLFVVIVKTKLQKHSVNLLVSLAVVYSSIVALGQFILQHSMGGWFWFLGERTFNLATPGIARADFCFPSLVFGGNCSVWLRSYGTFPHPNVLAGFLTMSLPIVLYECLTKTKSIARAYYLLVFILGIIALFFTFTRSAWLISAVVCAWIVVVVTKHKSIKINNLSVLVAMAALFLLIILGSGYYFDLTKQSESVVVRQDLVNAAFNIWRTSPVVGAGAGNFLVQLPKELLSKTIYFLQPVHNIYLLILAETGLIGLLVFLWALGRVFLKRQDKKIRKAPNVYKYCLAALLVLGLFDHYAVTLQQGQLILIVLLSLSL